MGWLTSAWLFYVGLPIFFAGQFAFVYAFMRDPDSGKTTHEEMTEKWRDANDNASGFVAIREHLAHLLRQGYDQGCAVLAFKGTEAFIQFRKYIHAKGDSGLELGFPDAEWSREYFPKLVEWCEKNGFSSNLDCNSQGGGLNFLHVDTGDDLDRAMQLVEGIVIDIFGLESDTRFFCQFDGVNELGEEINDPFAAPLSSKVTKERREEKYFEKTGVHIQDGCLYASVGLLGITGIFGLEYSLLWRAVWLAIATEPGWGGWPLEILGISLKTRTFEIVCLFLVMIGMLLRRSPPFCRIDAFRRQNASEAERKVWRRRQFRNRFIILPIMFTALGLFWLRG